MKTLVAQTSVTLCLLLFAAVACSVARSIPASSATHRHGWTLTAAAFLIQGINLAVHDGFAIHGFLQGPGSAAWNAIIQWHPILNHSRTLHLTTYCIVFGIALLHARRRQPPPRLAFGIAFMIGGMIVGGLIGWRELPFTGPAHFAAVAVWDTVELLAMLSLLLVGLSTGGMDRMLWGALSVQAFALALGVLWFADFARSDLLPGDWSLRPYEVQFFRALVMLSMTGFALRLRMSLRRGGPPGGFLETRRWSSVAGRSP